MKAEQFRFISLPLMLALLVVTTLQPLGAFAQSEPDSIEPFQIVDIGNHRLASVDGQPLIAPFSFYQTWKVSGSYGEGPCHHDPPDSCGDPDSELYAFDLVRVGGGTCAAPVYSPAPGLVVYRSTNIGAGLGGRIGIRLDDNTVVYLTHINPGQFTVNQSRVDYHTLVGRVYCRTTSGNHLHIQHNRSDHSAIPLTLSGRYYNPGTYWTGTEIQHNYLAANENFGGSLLISLGTGLASDLRQYNFNDIASSVRINPGCSSTLWTDINQGGSSKTFSTTDSTLVDDGLDDQVSSWNIAC